MASRNIERTNRNTTVMGGNTLLNSVGVFCYSYDQSVELSARVEQGKTTHVVEIKVTQKAGKELAKRLASELNLTPADFGWASPSEVEAAS